MKSVKTYTFKKGLVNGQALNMELFTSSGTLEDRTGIIEKTTEDGNVLGYHIGLWWSEDKEGNLILDDYDGAYDLSKNTRAFIKMCGISLEKL